MEYIILRSAQKFLVIDYGLRINPIYQQAKLQEDRTLADNVEATLLDVKMYEYLNSTDQMYLIKNEDGSRVLVEGKQFQGVGLKKGEVIRYIGDLRA